MAFYDDMQGIANDLFRDFNQGVIAYIQVTPGNGPADNPGPSTETPYTLDGATSRGVQFKYVQRDLAVASDLQVSFGYDARFEPAANGFVTIDGTRYKIVQIVRKPEAGTVVAWTLIVRK